MINQPNIPNKYTVHKLYDTLANINEGILSIIVGSWATEDTGLRPIIVTTLLVKYPKWSPDIIEYLDITINEHPDWSGASIGTKPNELCYYNIITKQWEDLRDLEDIKVSKWLDIKAYRAYEEYYGFTYDGSIFDSDPSSQARINVAVTLAIIAKQANQPYEITWTLSNGDLRTLSADEMISVGLALGTHVQTNFNKGQQLQQQLTLATTKEEVEAIVW